MVTASPLVTVDALAHRLDASEPPVVLDVRWSLPTGPQPQAYRDAHVPGARFVDLEADLSDPAGEPVDDRGRHPLPDPERFLAAMRRVGVSAGSSVVAYDEGGGLSAARLWWLLRHHGHADVAVLDGGFRAWHRAGLPVESGAVVGPVGDLTGEPGAMPVVDAGGAVEVARDGVLVDARAASRFRGEEEPVDPVAGHVPGAVSVPTTFHVGPDGHWLDGAGIAAQLPDAGTATAAYCGSGVTACHTVLAGELAGRTVALYPGSWSGWVSDPSRPVATGP